MNIYWIDLFCGGGGTTTGIHNTGKAKVLCCVNHDPMAIKSHAANHPDCVHYTEDIRDMAVVEKIKKLVDKLREIEPDAIINLWASLECTNYSKAKGGLPRDADSRTLAYSLYAYIDAICPAYIYIENVREFMAWGPLDANGKPLSRNNGIDYMKWIEAVQHFGYNYSYKILNAADYGAYTSRERYFGIFSLKGFPIEWPQATHTKNPEKEIGLFGKPMQKWKPVKDVLDFADEGESIFARKKPLVESTLNRIYAGLLKFVANGDDSFIKKYFSGRPKGKVISVDGPAGTITTIDGQALVKCDFLLKYNSMNQNGKYLPPSLDEPSPVVSTQGRLAKVNLDFLTSYYGNFSVNSVDAPCPTLTTKDRIAKIRYLMLNYSNGGFMRSIEQPAATIVNNDKHNLVECERWLLNPQYSNKGGSIDNPCFTLIARMDKMPPYLVSTDKGTPAIIIYDNDSETMTKIKIFMAHYGIVDIKMRMLKIKELLQIQGFPKDYKLMGTKTDQKKFIGNAVECTIAKALAESNFNAISNFLTLKTA